MNDLTLEEDQVPEGDPWDDRDAYLDEGHDELEVEAVTVVEADTDG